MILEMKVPSPGESIKEVEIATWLVKDGDYVEKDQAIAEVDSDKATLELPAEVSGTITLKAEEGDTVAVGAVVCLIDTEGKPSGAAPAAESPKVVEAPKPVAAEVALVIVISIPLLIVFVLGFIVSKAVVVGVVALIPTFPAEVIFILSTGVFTTALVLITKS